MTTKKLTIFTLLLFSLFSCKHVSKESAPPNIIVFLVDDMGLMDTSVPFLTDSTGNPQKYPLNDFYRTPHMESLASQGIRFTNFYAHSVCSPTRISLMSGQNSARHRATNWIRSEGNNRTKFGPQEWNWEGLNSSSVTLPRILQQAGYTTIHAGKAHFGPIGYEGEDPLNLGFDVNIAGNSFGQPGSYYAQDAYGLIKGWKARAVPGLEKYHGTDTFLTEAITLEANAAITRAKEEGKPFFLHMAHFAVHAPFQSDPRFADNYKDSGHSEKAQAYATLIEGIDKSLGDIIAHVNQLGLGENTFIMFLGDNGSDAPLGDDAYSSSSPLKGKKGNHWEGGMRVPFIASWIKPDSENANQKRLLVPANAIQEQMGSVLDILPTVCELAGVSDQADHITDGFALQSQLAGMNNNERKETFLNHFPHGNHRTNYFTSLVVSDWKVIYHYPVEGEAYYELFNLKDDPFESRNIAAENKEQLKLMMELLQSEMESKNALYPELDGKPVELVMP
ncbi:sulfatase-like hydrolase/transferase [Carboxylicivirga sp. RSCT41]|uniref:sulfatase-like hydrolase/transferase n=1 Tax=Carboxylicivirga agarovorans TaxID=3417570 RepID=UPI003D336AFE